MSNCPGELNFSLTHARKRREAARNSLGEGIALRIMAFGLFLMGARREDIAGYLGMPMGTLLSFLTRVGSHGLDAVRDRRCSKSTSPPQPKPANGELRCSAQADEGLLRVTLGMAGHTLTVPLANTLQSRAVLFTLLDNKLLAVDEVAQSLSLSPRRVRELTRAMRTQDLIALVDKRKGQMQDYRFTPEVKSELVQQVVINAITGQPTSSRAIVDALQERCGIGLSDRSVRWQMNKLGLTRIVHTLPILVMASKKNSTR